MYVRAVVARDGVEVIAGLEWRGEYVDDLRRSMRIAMDYALRHKLFDDDMKITEGVEAALLELWPGRAYFIEVSHDPDEGWVQVFQPYGVPKETDGSD